VLVLTGNPGVGKHTVSKKLAKILGYEIIDVNKEAVKVGMSEQNDSIDVDVEKTQRILKEKISDKSLVVGHLAPFVVSKELVSTAIVLRKSPYELIQIYERRNYSNKKKNDNLGSEILVIQLKNLVKIRHFKSTQHLLQLKRLPKKSRV